MEYLHVPLVSLPSVALDRLDSLLNLTINKIDELPVRFQVYQGGIVIFLAKSFAYRQDCITQIHAPTMAECIEKLKTIRINAAGVLDTAEYNVESELYAVLRDKLKNTPHITLIDRQCAVCYNYTPHMVPHLGSIRHPLCNRCILKVERCPICRQKILLESDLDTDSEEDLMTEVE